MSSGPAQPVAELSGGNQQKVTVARTLAHHPSLIVAITPTRGVDVASKELLLSSLAGVAATSGAGVLLCSDELSDLVICDRVLVLVRGEVFTEFSRAALRPRRADRRDRGHDRLPGAQRPLRRQAPMISEPSTPRARSAPPSGRTGGGRAARRAAAGPSGRGCAA